MTREQEIAELVGRAVYDEHVAPILSELDRVREERERLGVEFSDLYGTIEEQREAARQFDVKAEKLRVERDALREELERARGKGSPPPANQEPRETQRPSPDGGQLRGGHTPWLSEQELIVVERDALREELESEREAVEKGDETLRRADEVIRRLREERDRLLERIKELEG